MYRWSGQSELDDLNAAEIINSSSVHRINQDKLQSVFENLEYEGTSIRNATKNEATAYTPSSSGLEFNGDENNYWTSERRWSKVNFTIPAIVQDQQQDEVKVKNVLGPPGDNDDLNRERIGTPEYIVENDPILAGTLDYSETDDNSSINQQAVEFMNKLIIQRNAFIDINAQLQDSQDFFHYDDINMSGLLKKPNNFLIIGKPGIGQTTFATKFAQNMNLVYISPATAVDYFNSTPQDEDSFSGLDDWLIFDLICKRIRILDVHHRGYILDGWPIVRSEHIPVAEQLDMIRTLPYRPDIIFIMQMQDQDLFKRRINQKLDPMTMKVYTKKHYIRSSIPAASDLEGIQKEIMRKSVERDDGDGSDLTDSGFTVDSGVLPDRSGDLGSNCTDLDPDFLPLDSNVVGRLVSRIEDHPSQIERDFEVFRKAVQAIQAFINSLDKTRVFELDSYWTPTTIMKNAMSIIKALGIIPACIPLEIFRPVEKLKKQRPKDEIEGYSSDEEGCIPDPNEPNKQEEFPPDWEAIMRAVVVRGRIDPRFRWHISKWKNLCPVALKGGRSIEGIPEYAYGLHDKVYFLSSPDAVQKFTFNPRQFLVKSMPSSPVKFFIIGHPLAGKTMFAHELAKLSGGTVVDMNEQVKKRLECVKQRYLFKTRFETTMAAKKAIDKENYESWKRQERIRREKVKKWVADYIRRKAEEEINKALAAEREERMKKYREMRCASEFHELSACFKGSCNASGLAFSWKKFVEDIRKGKDTWSLQEQLELAWELFNEGKLRYKSKKTHGPVKLRHLRQLQQPEAGDEEAGDEETEDEDEEVGEEDDESDGEESLGEEEETEKSTKELSKPSKKRRRQRKRRPYCQQNQQKPEPLAEVAVITDDEDSSPLSSEDEPDESLRMRYPEMCLELTESVPKPSPVCDQDERVQALVKVRVDEKEKWTNELPSEIYGEIMHMGIRDAEECYQKRFPYAHFTGGWIVENLILDLDKWRSILRNSDLCPDQVYVLQDTSQDYVKITNNLKKLFAATHPGSKISIRRKRMGEMLGEGEDAYYPNPQEQRDDVESVQDGQESTNDEIYPNDNLEGRPCTTESTMRQLEIDGKRHQSPRLHSTTTSEGSAIFYENLPNVLIEDKFCGNRDRTTNSESFQTLTSPSIPTDCNSKLWHTVVSERNLGIVAQPSTKLVPCEMKVILSYDKAINVALHPIDVSDIVQEEIVAVQVVEKKEEDEVEKQSVLNLEGEEGEGGLQEEEILSQYARPELNLTDSRLDEKKTLFTESSGKKIDEDEVVKTPSGINSLEDVDCTHHDIAADEGDDDGGQKQCKHKALSVKKLFFKQISHFNGFWNMIYPVMKQSKIHHWDVSIVDELTVQDKARSMWDALESRFKLSPKHVTTGELEEDDADVTESKIMWTKNNNNNIRKFSNEKRSEFDEVKEDSDDGEVTADDETAEESTSDEDGEEDNYMGRSKDSLKRLERKPEEYRNFLSNIEANRLFGTYNYYCPVTLYDFQIIRKGSPTFAARYQDRLYYMVSEEALTRFMNEPDKFLPISTIKCIPPRICITGAPACSQKEIALNMAEKAGIYYVNFRDRLQEVIKSRTGSDVGPQFTGEIVTRIDSDTSRTDEAESDEEGITAQREADTYVDDDESMQDEEEDFDPNVEWIKEKEERKAMELQALRSLGIGINAQVVSYPIDSIQRTEMKADLLSSDGQLTIVEKHIKSFLESGAQLPPFVLDEFIPALWNEEPFKSKGFVLVGFPNTPKDIQYMTGKNCWPERVYIMECKKKTCRNRLIRQTLERCSQQRRKMGGGERKKKRDPFIHSFIHQRRTLLKQTNEYEYQGLSLNAEDEVDKGSLPFKNKIGKALLYYHDIYTNKIPAMKIDLNKRRIQWTSFSTDLSLLDAKNKLIKAITPSLRYRESLFEATYVLQPDEAEALLQKRYFHLSRLKRWCPVEISKGNTGINLWNAPGVIKYPVLYRNYIYFIAGQENLEHFRDNVVAMTKQSTPSPSVPFHVVVVGPPKAGKTEICRRIAQDLGFLYVNEDGVINRIIDHANAANLEYESRESLLIEGPQPMIFAQKVETYLRRGHSVPRYMFYRSLDFMLMEPLAQHHGVVFDGYPMEDMSIQELLERGIIPGLIVQIEIELETALQRCEKQRRIPNFDFRDLVQDCDEVITRQLEAYGPMKSPCVFWFGSHMQCLLKVNGARNPAAIAEEIENKSIQAQVLKQKYILE